MRSRFLRLLAVLPVILFVSASCNSTKPPTKPTPTLASLIVSCDPGRLTQVGQQARCSARATMSDGQTEDRTAAAQWSSSDPAKVTVNGGVATAVAPGNADVTAKVEEMSAKQTMSVEIGCAFSLSPTVAAFAAAGGSQVVTVSASPDGCTPAAWTAASDNPILTVAPAEGSGTGTVTVTAAANGAQPQTRLATIAGQTFTANLGAACTVAFSPAGSDDAGPTAGQRDVEVAVANGPCRWTAASSDNWIAVSQTEGTGNATVRVTFAQNPGGDRTGSVTFTGPACNPQCRNASTTVFVRQARGVATLSLTLEQGEHLSGPYAGYATGPNGYTCTLGGSVERVTCAPLVVPMNTSVTIVITLTVSAYDGPIFRTFGCDSRGAGSCIVMMNRDRSVTIGVGCATICSGLDSVEPPEPEQLVVVWPELASVRPGKYR